MDTKTTAALAAFVSGAQSIVDAHFSKNFTNLKPNKLSVEPGRRYARIVTTRVRSSGEADANSRSVYCFIDLTNGDVLKSESWKKPAKHARGNIFAGDGGLKGVDSYGAKYLS